MVASAAIEVPVVRSNAPFIVVLSVPEVPVAMGDPVVTVPNSDSAPIPSSLVNLTVWLGRLLIIFQ